MHGVSGCELRRGRSSRSTLQDHQGLGRQRDWGDARTSWRKDERTSARWSAASCDGVLVHPGSSVWWFAGSFHRRRKSRFGHRWQWMSQRCWWTLVAQCFSELPSWTEASLRASGGERSLQVWSRRTCGEHSCLHLPGWNSWKTGCCEDFGRREGGDRMPRTDWAFRAATVECGLQVCHEGDAIAGCGEAYEVDFYQASRYWLDGCTGTVVAALLALWRRSKSKKEVGVWTTVSGLCRCWRRRKWYRRWRDWIQWCEQYLGRPRWIWGGSRAVQEEMAVTAGGCAGAARFHFPLWGASWGRRGWGKRVSHWWLVRTYRGVVTWARSRDRQRHFGGRWGHQKGGTRERENEIYWTASSKKTMNKGLKRKLGHCVKEIKEGFQHEKTRSVGRTLKKDLKKAPDKAKRSRPFSVLEVFTWTCAISLVAASRGWTAYEPVTLPGWDLMKDSDYKMALEYIDRVSPDLLVIAWPCTKWSRLQTMGRKSVLQLARLVTERKKQRKLLRFTRDAALRQRKRRGRVLGENPATSLAWKEPLIVEAFDGLAHEVTDMCCYGLRIPGKGALRKRTRLAGHKGVMKYCVKKCCCRKPHVPVLGSAKIGGRWRSVSDFAGGYTKEFAEAVIRGAEEDLENDEDEAEVFVEGGVPEEIWRPEDEAEAEDRSEAEEHRDEDGDVVMGEDAEKIKKGSVKWKVRALHQRLGHPTKATLRRMLVLSGAPKEVIHEAENYNCPICLETAMRGRYLKQKAEIRPVSFGKELHCDLKYIHDHSNKLFVALSVVDAATSYHMAVLLRSRAAAHVARKFHRHWCSLYGCPEDVILDQGGEFDGAFVAWLEAHGIHSKLSGARSAWQHGFAERHGAVLGTMCTSLIWQYQARGATQVKDCLCAAVQAKNMTLTRKGYTPYQMVFGRSPLFPDLLEEDTAGNMALRDSLTMEGEVSRAAEMRAAARAVLLRQDVQQKLKRALTRIPRGEDREYDPGEKVFFYVPTPKTARFRRGGGFWRGPALIIMRESSQRYYISWRGRCLMVSAPNLRPASELEALNHEERMEEARALEEHLEKKEYEDLSNQAQPDEEGPEEPEESWMPQEGVIRRVSKGGRSKGKATEVAKLLKGAKVKIKTIKSIKKTKRKSREHKTDLRQPGRSNEEQKKDVEEKNEELRRQLDIFMRQPREEEFTEDVKRNLQDDVPIQFKRKRQEDIDLMDEDGLRKRIRKEVLNYTMLASTPRRNGRRSNEWASRAEVKKLASLLDLPIVNARYHIEPRKRFQRPPSGSYGGRITVMLQEQAGTGMICQETAEDMRLRPRRRSAAEWKGMTLFLRKEKSMEKSTYVEMPDGVYEVMVTNYEDWKKLWISEDENQAFCEAYLLLNKANGKELDPKHFDQSEKEKFQEADRKEWMSWIENKVVRRLSPEEIQKVDKRLIFKAPARVVRVNKGALDGILRAKSRMVIPGHLDPHLGEYRSDAPTTAWVAVQMAKCIATNRGWMASSFDVSTAFLSGKEVKREVYIRAPLDGLPACPQLGEKAVAPGELLRVCKSAYGLSEAPRLWYLRATELLVEVGFKEIPMCRATYIWKKEDSLEVAAILCLHVDDGLLVASKDTMDHLKKSINERFSIKEWQDLGEKPVTFLGVKTKYVGGVFYDDMSDYVANLQEAEVDASAKKDAVLQGASLSAYRRLIMQLRWPAHLVMPEFLYVTSAMARPVLVWQTLWKETRCWRLWKKLPGLVGHRSPSVLCVVTSCSSRTSMLLWAAVEAVPNKEKFTWWPRRRFSVNLQLPTCWSFIPTRSAEWFVAVLLQRAVRWLPQGTGCCTIELCTTPYALVCWSLTRNGAITYAPLDALWRTRKDYMIMSSRPVVWLRRNKLHSTFYWWSSWWKMVHCNFDGRLPGSSWQIRWRKIWTVLCWRNFVGELRSVWFKLLKMRSRKNEGPGYVELNAKDVRSEFRNPPSQHLFPLMWKHMDDMVHLLGMVVCTINGS